MRDFVYERTDHYKMAIAKSPIQGGEVGEETYEALDPDIYMQDNGEDNAYVITDNMAAAMQEDGENNAYYVVTDNMATGMQGDGEDDAYVVPDYIMQGDGAREDTYEALEDIAYTADRGGVRESGLYDEPDNTGARSTSLRVKYELH